LILAIPTAALGRSVAKVRSDLNLELTNQPAPAIRADCEQNECLEPAKHFKHCSEKIEGGKGWQGEDCVEELFHMMHCVDVSLPLHTVRHCSLDMTW